MDAKNGDRFGFYVHTRTMYAVMMKWLDWSFVGYIPCGRTLRARTWKGTVIASSRTDSDGLFCSHTPLAINNTTRGFFFFFPASGWLERSGRTLVGPKFQNTKLDQVSCGPTPTQPTSRCADQEPSRRRASALAFRNSNSGQSDGCQVAIALSQWSSLVCTGVSESCKASSPSPP